MTQEAIEQAVDAVFSALPPLTRVWIGYSGGMDSHVLLDAACRVMNRLPQLGGIHPIHIHHGLHPDADQWTAHCQSVCADLGLICRVIQVDAANTEGKGPERSAREARYAAYQSVIKPGDELLLAHHQNDQAETLLLQLFRGAGPNGLAAMPRCQTFGVGQIWRPFLHLSRDMLRQYAESHALKWVEDISNADLAMDRNYLRHQVIPAIRERWPQVDATIARSARMCAEISHWVEDQLAEKHADLNANPLPVRLLASQTQPAQRLLLRAWLKQVGLIVPSEQRLGEMLRQILDAEADAQVCLAHDQHEIRRHDQHVYVLKPLPNEAAEWSAALSTGSVELPNGLGRVFGRHR